MRVLNAFSDETGINKVCVPDDVTVGQKMDLFIKYMRDNPQERHDEAFIIFSRSMIEAFPCP